MADVKRDIYISINGKEVANSLTGLRGEIRNIERDIRNLNRNDKDYQETLRQHQQRLAAVREEYSRARQELGQTPSLLQRIKNELGEVGTGFIKAFTIQALVASVVMGVRNAINIIKEFDQAQADLAGILETTRTKILSLTFDAMKLGATTSFTATQVSNAQLELAKLGKSIDEIRNMTPGVLNAAVAMGTDLAPAAELVAGQMNSFSAASSDAGKYADILSNSTNISATSFEYLATALPKTSKVAAVANVSFEKLNATMGALSDETIAAETAGTGFRNILLTAAKEGVPYEELLQKVKNSQNQLNEATKLFGKENATVAVIIANSTEKIQTQTEALENSSGSAEKLAQEKLNSLTGDLKLYDSAMEGFTLGVENGNGALNNLARGAVQLATSFLGLITPTRNVSDELFDQQMAVNELISKITSSNIKDEERIKLLKELADNYPDVIQNIDIETVSNEDLIRTLKEVNKNYRERIALQLEVEKSEKIREKRDGVAKDAAKYESKLREKLQKVINDNSYEITVDWGNVEKSAKEVMNKLKADGNRTGIFSDYASIQGLVDVTRVYNVAAESVTKELEKQNEVVTHISKAKKIQTESDRAASEQAKKDLDELVSKAEKMGGKKGKSFKEDDIESVKKYIVARQAELDTDMYANTKKGELAEKERQRREKAAERKQKAEEKENERKKKIYEDAEKEIDKIILTSIQNREMSTLTGIRKDIALIENKYAQELIKYKDHKDRLKDLESSRDAEIAEVKRLKNTEYMLQQFDIEKQIEEEKEIWRLENKAKNATSEEERQLLLIDKARYVADLEIQNELDKELAKIENVEMAEDLKQAIRDKYAQKKAQNDEHFAEAERALKTKQLDWTKITEQEKLNIARNSLNAASEAFNEGTGPWKAAKIAETVISTYQSATNSYNSLSGIPVVGPALGAAAAALAVTVGLKNIQKISSTKIPEMPSYYYGGYTSRASGNLGGDKYGEFTGMTHANEWVAPAFMTQNPRYADTFSWLEFERKNGIGSTYSNKTTNTQTNDPALFTAIASLVSVTSELNNTLTSGRIRSNTIIGYREAAKIADLNKEIEQLNQ